MVLLNCRSSWWAARLRRLASFPPLSSFPGLTNAHTYIHIVSPLSANEIWLTVPALTSHASLALLPLFPPTSSASSLLQRPLSPLLSPPKIGTDTRICHRRRQMTMGQKVSGGMLHQGDGQAASGAQGASSVHQPGLPGTYRRDSPFLAGHTGTHPERSEDRLPPTSANGAVQTPGHYHSALPGPSSRLPTVQDESLVRPLPTRRYPLQSPAAA